MIKIQRDMAGRLTMVIVGTLFVSVVTLLASRFVSVPYEVIPYEAQDSAKRALYAYELDGLRMLFAAEHGFEDVAPGAQVLHRNEFWDADRCAGMTPSIFADTAFFVDRRIEVGNDGELVKRSLVYRYDFSPSTLTELTIPLLVERVYRQNGTFIVATRLSDQVIVLYQVDEKRRKLTLHDIRIIPKTHALLEESRFLRWCTSKFERCGIDERYRAFDRDDQQIEKLREFEERIYTHGTTTLRVPESHKNIFLGYSALNFVDRTTR